MGDLARLIAAVESGTATGGPDAMVVPRDMSELIEAVTGSDDDLWSAFAGAHDGSLDDAKALHEALLPGWAVNDMSQNGRDAGHPWGIRLAFWNASSPSKNKHVDAGWGRDGIPDNNPARAWLLAILRALEAEGKA